MRIGSDNSYGVYLSQMLFINALIWAGWARLDSVVWWAALGHQEAQVGGSCQ